MTTIERMPTGVPGLDEIVGGGLPARATYLLMGQPGTGKTTIGLQFLLEGARRGERCLYICLAETRGQLSAIADAYGFALDGIDVHEMRHRGASRPDGESGGYTVFRPSEVELEEISRELGEQFERVRPERMVLDSLSEIRLLSEDAYRYRREVLDLCDLVSAAGCTGLLIDVETTGTDASIAETLAHGVIELEQLSPAYGGARRRLRIRKLRASKSIGGYHDFKIESGVEVFPRLMAAPHRTAHVPGRTPSGLPELDKMLGGGLDGGTSTLIMGPTGTGKSTIATYFLAAAAARGDAGMMLCFDESPANLLIRTNSLGIGLAEHVKTGRVELSAIDPAEFSPGELSHRIRQSVNQGARVIVLDSINGYMNALPEERFLSAHLHELLAFLSEKGVTSILTLAGRETLMFSEAPVDISYVADTVLVSRFCEIAGEMRQALSVLKKRTGDHERGFREVRFGPHGLEIGPRLAISQTRATSDDGTTRP